MPPFRCWQFQGGLLITLPTFCDEIAAYCVSNADESDVTKDYHALIDMIKLMRSGLQAVSLRIKENSILSLIYRLMPGLLEWKTLLA
ncbi:unnamed protein product [Gongylonema pulchrum]|uniref:Tnp_DDE_dom domain-containing protein n=1 Tax=Gongylonema pulchrum TaxID=637853 RepID=A0A183DBH9_9BILA|nr:unnamed protein product [Gongylonema pulchrum]